MPPAVSSVWLDVLLEAIPSLTKDIIRRDLLSLAVARSQLSQTVISRKSGCLIFGTIAHKFEPFWYVTYTQICMHYIHVGTAEPSVCTCIYM